MSGRVRRLEHERDAMEAKYEVCDCLAIRFAFMNQTLYRNAVKKAKHLKLNLTLSSKTWSLCNFCFFEVISFSYLKNINTVSRAVEGVNCRKKGQGTTSGYPTRESGD
jgi:hypothetical protein